MEEDLRQEIADLREKPKVAEEAQADADEPQIHVVQPGDSLSKIAKDVYGDASRWREIFEANRDQISEPNLIRPGWKLRIP
jgi:nucleoid-associated protein YgaU